jgi:hypothetical protein
MFLRNGMLATLNFFVVKLFHMAALQAKQVIVMTTPIKFVNRFVIVKVMSNQNAGMLELGQHAVHRGEADIDAIGHQQTIHIVGGQMALIGLFEQGEDFQAWAGDFQAQGLELIGAGHVGCRL